MLPSEGQKISKESHGGSGMGSHMEEVNRNFTDGGLSRIGNENPVWLVGIWEKYMKKDLSLCILKNVYNTCTRRSLI